MVPINHARWRLSILWALNFFVFKMRVTGCIDCVSRKRDVGDVLRLVAFLISEPEWRQMLSTSAAEGQQKFSGTF
ncbi:uncharacterized protein BDW70DRAFT_131760 [Aspergillus foveolatus]|uniref:uncharacterized protein n=1 Tax=Aspergillus foveolatus TaxID=210207 RepID=UPI003CCD20FC